MKRAMLLAPALLLCWFGLAQGYITWGPVSRIPCPELARYSVQRTSANNTWSVVGGNDEVMGADIGVAYEGLYGRNDILQRAVFYTRTIDGGDSWSPPIPLNDEDADSSGCPSLARINQTGEQIAVAFISWFTVNDEVLGKVQCRASTNFGRSWGDIVNPAAGISSKEHACHVSAAASPCNDEPNRFFDVVWEEPYLDYGAVSESICNQSLDITGDELHQYDDDEICVVNSGIRADLRPRTPSVYSTASSCNAGCAWVQGITPDDTVYTNWRQYRGYPWDGNPAVAILPDSAHNHGFPSIACLDTVDVYECVSHELVACDATYGANSTDRALVVSFRDWGQNYLDEWMPKADWYSVWYRPWDIAGVQLLRPNLYANNRFVRGSPHFRTYADTAYMVFTARPNSSSELGNVFYTSIYPDRSHSPWDWHSDEPKLLGAQADSACIVVYENMAYATFKSRRSGISQDSIAVRAGIVNFGPPLVLAEGLPAAAAGRLLARLPGSDLLHRTFALDNFINYERSTNNGETWGYQDAPDFGTSPTMALGPDGLPWIAYIASPDSAPRLGVAILNPDSSWILKTVFAADNDQHLGPPSLAVFQSTGGWNGASPALGQVAFPVYPASGPGFVLHARFDTLGVWLDTLDVCTGSDVDSCVSLCAGLTDSLHAVFMRNDSVFYRYARYDTNSIPASFWSSPFKLNFLGRTGRHPYIDQVGDRAFCVWREQDFVNVDEPVYIARAVHFTSTGPCAWIPLSPASRVDGNPKDWPTFSGEFAVAWSEDVGSGNWEILARVGTGPDTIANLSNTTAASKYPHIVADPLTSYSPSSDMINVHCLWAEQVAGDTCEVRCEPVPVVFAHAGSNATQYNNSHKLLLGPGDTLLSVFSASAGPGGGVVGFATLAPGSTEWVRSFPMGGETPCIGRDSAGWTWIAGLGQSGQSLMASAHPAGTTTWAMTPVYDCGPYFMSNTTLGVPAIAGSRYNPYWSPNCPFCYSVFPVYNHQVDSSFIVMVRAAPWGVQDVDTVDRADIAEDSFPSVGVMPGNILRVAWSRGSRVYCRTGGDSLWQGMPIDWSPAYAISDTDSLARYPSIEVSADTVLTTWVEGTTGRIRVRGQAPADAYDAWGSSITVSDTSSYGCDYPTISIGDTVVVVYQRYNGSGADVFVNVGLAENYQVTSGNPAAYGHVAYQRRIQDGDTQDVAHCVWSEEPGNGYYDVGYTAFSLSAGGGGGQQNVGLFDPNIRPTLFAPAPNPFNGMTTIRYQTNIRGLTRVTVMDVTGRRVRNLLTMPQNPGIYNLTWNARDDRARQLPRGVYFVRLETSNYNEARKLILTE